MTNREDTTMTTRRTPTQMAQDALDTAQRKVERARARIERAAVERDDAFAAEDEALADLLTAHGWHDPVVAIRAPHPWAPSDRPC